MHLLSIYNKSHLISKEIIFEKSRLKKIIIIYYIQYEKSINPFPILQPRSPQEVLEGPPPDLGQAPPQTNRG